MMRYRLYRPAREPIPEGDLYVRRPRDLQPMSRLRDWRVAEGEPDIRGWTVYDSEAEIPLGSVEDLLVSVEMARAIFIVVYTGEVIGESYVDSGVPLHLNRRHIPVPADWTELDMPDRRVLFNGTFEQLSGAPDYEAGTADIDRYYDYWQRA